jgi:beta-lactam-binding protein with PASTA domain
MPSSIRASPWLVSSFAARETEFIPPADNPVVFDTKPVEFCSPNARPRLHLCNLESPCEITKTTDMRLRAITTSQTAPGSLAAKLLIIGLAFLGTRPASTTASSGSGATPIRVVMAASVPVTIGDRIAGGFRDATGHSAQSHLVYAANSRVWWLFTLTSDADSEGGSNHVVKSFRSSGPDLATATWTEGASSPPVSAGSPNQFLGGGRSLGIAYLNNSPLDVIHADISMAFDGQDGRTGHIRAVVTGTSITWSSWNLFDEPAATWTLPRGNTIGVSTGKFIHTGGPILQQEVDANVRKSNSADTGNSWTSGFSVPAVIDGSMLNQDNALAFAPLANNVMLAVYDNGQGVEPNQTNLRYKRSNAGGAWSPIVVGSQLGGDGDVFQTNATIDQNDWGVVPVNTNQIYAFRRKANGSGIDAASYNVLANSWSAMSPAPPPLGANQSIKAGAGLFGATDGTAVWVFAINTDLANSILYSRFDGATWAAWAVVPGTEIGIQSRNYISGAPQAGNNQIGLIWTEGTLLFDVVTGSLSLVASTPDLKAPAVSITAPTTGVTVSGTISITAAASDNVGVAGVQFRLDGADLDREVTAPPFTVLWNTAASPNGAHVVTAIARDDAGNTATAIDVGVTVENTANVVPNVVGLTSVAARTAIAAAELTLGTVTLLPSAAVPPGSVISQSPPGGAKVAAGSVVNLVVSSGPPPVVMPDVVGLTLDQATTSLTDAGLKLSAVTAAASTTVPAGSVIDQTPGAGTQVTTGSAVALVVSSGPLKVAVPDVVGLAQVAATTAITSAGLVVGVITTASSSTVVEGSVISQDPVAGRGIPAGSAVDLILSSGPGTGTPPSGSGAIGINFVGSATPMSVAETAGVIAKPNWNNATGAVRSTALPLVDEQGSSTGATVTWTANNIWKTVIADQPGNARMMKGYLDSTNGSTTTVTVAGLVDRAYDVYVYADGDNRAFDRSAAYTISGAGMVPTTGTLTDAANTNFETTFTLADDSNGNYVKFTITGTGFTVSATPLAPLVGTRRAPLNGIQIVPAAPEPVPSVIGVRFLGTSTAMMAADESAGIVAQSHWNNASGAVRSTPLPLVDDGGDPTTATVTWTANNGWMTPIADQPGNARLMKGYLDTSTSSVTTVSVSGLQPGVYDVYVYAEGDNRQYTRTAAYRITGPGITAATMNLTDQANTNFSGTFIEATPESGTGNYLKFRIDGTGFTLTGTPGTSTNTSLRAPINAIQIVSAPR